MKKYDLIVIGLGPAGMTVSVMASKMGLNVLAVEKNKIGGECLNVGCIPSKGILKLSEEYPGASGILARTAVHVGHVAQETAQSILNKKMDVLQNTEAFFENERTIRAGSETFSAKYIFIATGTSPAVPPVKGMENVECLTNENVFSLPEAPKSMIIIGGGAMGTEMATAFSRMGCRCTIIHQDAHLLPQTDEETAKILEDSLKKAGTEVYNGEKIAEVKKTGAGVMLITESGKKLEAERLLAAAGRKQNTASLKLENAGVKYTKSGISVDKYLRTNKKHIFAVGDCNGYSLLSHAAMHQGMIGLMNTFLPFFFKKDFRKYPVPWTVFTVPEVSHTGKTAAQLDQAGIKYEVHTEYYAAYGAAIAEELTDGYIRIYVSKSGEIYGVTAIGAHSGEIINEWTLAIQNGINLGDMIMTQHSFPTMGYMNKKVAERWMMQRIKPGIIHKLARLFFH